MVLEQCTDTMVEPFLFSLSNEKYFYDYIAHPDAFFFAWLTPTSVMASDRPNRVLEKTFAGITFFQSISNIEFKIQE